MKMRFEVGEPAIFAVAASADQMNDVGKQGTVEMIGPFHVGQLVTFKGNLRQVVFAGDYILMFDDVKGVIAKDWQLRKIDPPAEPESLKRTEDLEVTA